MNETIRTLLAGISVLGGLAGSGDPPTPIETSITFLPKPTIEITPKEIRKPYIDQVKVGETAKGNQINLVILRQDYEKSRVGKPIVWIIGGVHPGEKTGNERGKGWLNLVKEYFINNMSEWSGYQIAFLDANFDGSGRLNPNQVNIQRNFGGLECPSCNWSEKEITENNLCSSSGRPGMGPNSEPESQAIINAAKYLRKQGKIIFCVNFHAAAKLVESGACMDNGKNCQIAKQIAEKMGIPYKLRFDKYTCELHGEPDTYLREVFLIPTITMEFSQIEPNRQEANAFGQALTESIPYEANFSKLTKLYFELRK